MTGKVYLVGAGPGDPGLLTVKGLACIRKADVLVYDYLASPTLLKYADSDAEKIYVGKKGGDHTLSQDGINDLIAQKALEGHIVTRLKGGDPFIFGRGGEEAEILIEKGIPFEVVPGVTSAIAAPAYAGIPLTHRKFTSNLAFVTGHEDPTKDQSSLDWASLARGIGTLVFLMGVKNLPNIVEKLREHGRSPDTPVALVRWGTTLRQQTVTGTLDNIVDAVAKAGLKAPAVIVVGEVVSLRETMQWFENKPLMGRRIVVTRAREQASNLVDTLMELGAQCLEYPTIEVEPPDDWQPLDAAIDNLSGYDWLVFTSVNGVKYFFKRLFEKGLDVRALGSLKTAVIGPVTKDRLAEYGIVADILPESYRAESVVAALSNQTLQGKKVLLPRAREARAILPVELEKMGAAVDEITTYITRPVSSGADELASSLRAGEVDLITFTSSSTVTNFKALLPDSDWEDLLANVRIASIGPITTETAQSLGFEVDITAETYTIPGLCEAIVNACR